MSELVRYRTKPTQSGIFKSGIELNDGQNAYAAVRFLDDDAQLFLYYPL